MIFMSSVRSNNEKIPVETNSVEFDSVRFNIDYVSYITEYTPTHFRLDFRQIYSSENIEKAKNLALENKIRIILLNFVF